MGCERVIGRDHIPQNRQLIVVSNHLSPGHGTGEVRPRSYGHKLVALAAKDYFFEGNPWAVAYFEQLTNLKPIDRQRGYSASLQQAKISLTKDMSFYCSQKVQDVGMGY